MAIVKNQKASHSVVGFALDRGKNEVVNQKLEWIRSGTFLRFSLQSSHSTLGSHLLAMLNQRHLSIYIQITLAI
jgi:hypothetical protein